MVEYDCMTLGPDQTFSQDVFVVVVVIVDIAVVVAVVDNVVAVIVDDKIVVVVEMEL